MATDGRYVIENNYRFSLELFRWCQEQKVPLIYASSASVYGRGPVFVEDRNIRTAAQHLWLFEILV